MRYNTMRVSCPTCHLLHHVNYSVCVCATYPKLIIQRYKVWLVFSLLLRCNASAHLLTYTHTKKTAFLKN